MASTAKHSLSSAHPENTTGQSLSRQYQQIRRATEQLSAPLSEADCAVQSMPDASPTKWHLAHTSWFFETFVLERESAAYQPFHPQFRVLFNSYYQSVGEQYARPQRGLLTRPALREVLDYRAHVDAQMQKLLNQPDRLTHELSAIIELGLQHEQQHQELILTDIKHLFSLNPLRPVYRAASEPESATSPALRWQRYDEGLYDIGHAGDGFAFDNELPRHRVFLNSFELAARAVTNREYLAFINDGGYERPEWWLSGGWLAVQEYGWRAPLYWQHEGDAWFTHTLTGWRAVNPDEPVTHISYYEADAYARWADDRLPTEFEWEVAANEAAQAATAGETDSPQSAQRPQRDSTGSVIAVSSVTDFSAPGNVAQNYNGNFVESGRLHPAPADAASTLAQMFGDVWEWTRSPYSPYPGFHAAAGALGEYNGKFMCNQMVLRGGSCVTPASHIRATWRNFFPPQARWQFSGLRLARDARS